MFNQHGKGSLDTYIHKGGLLESFTTHVGLSDQKKKKEKKKTEGVNGDISLNKMHCFRPS